MRLWSVTTTIRNPERIRSFLKILKELEGQTWNNLIQKKFQVLLIEHKVYGFAEPQFEKTLSPRQIEQLYSDNFTYKQAEKILESKNYIGGGDMRGRQSFNALEKLGLAYIDDEKKIKITSFGDSFLAENYDVGTFFFRSLIKWQYPNPNLNKYRAKDGYDIKPLIATFHLIKKINFLCRKIGTKEKGVSKTEFALFFTTLSNYANIDNTAKKVLEFRKDYADLEKKEPLEKVAQDYFYRNFAQYESWENAKEYTDNVIRYFRLTRFFYLRGNDYYIDLEPHRRVEIDSILEIDNASAKPFSSKAQYSLYLGDVAQPELPWETKEKLQEIISLLSADVEASKNELKSKAIAIAQQLEIVRSSDNTGELKATIENLRSYRRLLNDTLIHWRLQLPKNIEACILSLKNIFKLTDKKPVELEKLMTFGLHILNDAIGIYPNYPVGDDNQPTFTAPANKPDVECFYQSFNSICEVTLLTNRSQWFNEGQPVMRHFRDFEQIHNKKEAYCLFVAPKIHRDTANTFWISVKYEYEGKKQKIIPITIQQFIEILTFLAQAKRQKVDYFLSHQKIQELFDSIIYATEAASKADDWLSVIPLLINKWGKSIAI